MITVVDPPRSTTRRSVALLPPRVWPLLRFAAADRTVLVAAAVAGVIGAVVLGTDGIGSPITAAAMIVVVALARPNRPSAWQISGAVAVLVLTSVAVLRDAEWIVTLSSWSAVFVAAAVLSTAWTWTGLICGVLTPVLVPVRTARWMLRGVRKLDGRGLRPGRAAMVGVVTSVLVLVFAALFAAADPAFERLVDDVTPEWNPESALGRLVTFALVAAGALAASYVAVNTPRFDRLARSRHSLRLWEWMVPVTAVVALFAAFVAVQITTLFGGQARVRTTNGLTNAEYARQGFWQLLAVTALTLLVLAVTIGTAPRESAADRAAMRIVLGSLCLLALVVVASALHRMSLYEQQYGFTTLRVFVTAVELWLGSVFLLVLATGIRMSGRWLPRAVGVGAVLTVLGLAVLNPDAYIARHSVERFEQTGKIDTGYLAGLSDDAAPELERLPQPYRSCVVEKDSAACASLP